MSNQCSNLFNYRSFNLFPPFHSPLKPYATNLRPVFLFHNNLILFGRRSRNRTLSNPPPLAAQLSSEVVLVATTEHHDGSLVFRFGDACEVLKNDEVVEEIESRDEEESESNLSKVLDGDQERQVAENTIEGEYGSDSGCFTEVVDETRNEDMDNNVAKRETNVISDSRDYHAESIERLPLTSEEEVLSSQSDAEMNNSLEGVEGTLDKTECTTQLDEDESLNPTIFLLDNSPNRDESADSEGTLLKDSDDETEGQFVSVKLESIQAANTEVMDVKQSNAEDELQKVENEDASESTKEDLMPPATMQISDDEFPDAANEDVNEELQDMNINGITVIEEMPPPDPLGSEPLDEVSQLQSVDVVAEATIEVSSTKAMDVKDPSMEKELQEVIMNTGHESDVADVMPVSCVEEAEPILEEDISQPQPIPVELKPSIQVSDIELHDTMGQNLDDGILQTTNETEDSSVSFKLETMQVSTTGLMDITQPYVDDELHKVEPEDTSTGSTKDLPPPANMYISDVEHMDTANEDMEEGLLDMNINEGIFIDETPPSDPSGAEPALDELSQLQFTDPKLEATMDVKDHAVEDELQQVSNNDKDENNVANLLPIIRTDTEEAKPILEEEVSQPLSTPVEVEPTMQVPDIELQDTMVQNLDDGILQVIDETEDPSDSVKLETMQVSDIEFVDVTQPDAANELIEVETEDADAKDLMLPTTMAISDVELTEAANEDVKEGLQDIINDGTLIDGMPPFNILRAEPTSDELQQVSTNNRDENNIAYVMPAGPILEEEVSQPCSTSVELKPAMQDSDTEVQDTKDQNLDEGNLQLIDEDEGYSNIKDVERLLDKVEAQLVQDEGVNYNMLKQYAEIDASRNSVLLSSDEFAEASEERAIQLVTEAKVEREEIYLTGYFLSSGAALLEFPFKALTGGDDAYFVANNKWLGVANGLSQWSFEGTNPGVYAKELMKTCEKIILDTTTAPMTNPVELLCRCVKETNMSGSSNILIANFNGQALHVANIGDTGFIIVRHGAIYKKSSPLLHEFHFALQVEDRDNPLELVEEYIIEVEEGDIVVTATDGLFDNLYEAEIARVVSKSLQDGMRPKEVANVLATRAQEVGRSAYVRSPFSDAAQAAGYTGYTGGKSDNVAVIVSLISTS